MMISRAAQVVLEDARNSPCCAGKMLCREHGVMFAFVKSQPDIESVEVMLALADAEVAAVTMEEEYQGYCDSVEDPYSE